MSNVSLVRSVIKVLALSAAPLVTLMSGEAFAQTSSRIVAGQVGVNVSTDGKGTAAQFANPVGVAFNGSTQKPTLYVLEAGDGATVGGRIRAYDVATGNVTTLVGSGAFATTDTSGGAPAFAQPVRFVYDAAATTFYVTQANGALRKIDASRTVTTVVTDDQANSGVAVYGGKLYTTGALKPHIRVRNLATGAIDHVIPLPFCDEDGTNASRGLAADDNILHVACGSRVYRVDLANAEAVTLVSSFTDGVINGVRATGGGTFFILPGNYVYEIRARVGGTVDSFWTRDTSANDIARAHDVGGTRALVLSANANAECPSGQGVRIITGLDSHDANPTFFVGKDATLRVLGRVYDGVLDEDERTGNTLICGGVDGNNGNDGANGSNGTDGSSGANGADGLSVLVATTDEPAGENCASGGIRVDAGRDFNRDTVLLIPDEVETTSYVCNGATGANGADGATGPAGANGANGAAGANGEAGLAGANGADGLNGDDGEGGCATVGARNSGIFAALAGLVFLRRRRS